MIHKLRWEIVHESDTDSGKPTLWSTELTNNCFLWIEEAEIDGYNVIGSDAETVIKHCKSLSSTKRWVSMNYERLERRWKF